jgi:hypothetical protein
MGVERIISQFLKTIIGAIYGGVTSHHLVKGGGVTSPDCELPIHELSFHTFL